MITRHIPVALMGINLLDRLLLLLIKSVFVKLILYIFQAQVALRNLKSFAEYPMRMQTKIVQVGKYER